MMMLANKSNFVRGLKAVLLVLVLGCLTLASWFGYIFFNNPYNDWWFDEGIWKAQHRVNDQYNPRGKMLYDVERRILKKGMSRQQVLAVLGPPDDGQSKDVALTYSLGGWNALFPDVDTLIIEFDSADKVKDFEKLST